MAKKYKTKIEITAPASDKNEAMEIVGDYLSGNIVSGIDMKCSTKRVRFYDNAPARVIAVAILIGVGFLFTVKTSPQAGFNFTSCQTAAVQAPLKTSNVAREDTKFKKEWEEKQVREVLSFIKR
jgi:hypothetical protein